VGKGEKSERVKTKGWGSCYQTGNQGGWELVTTSKKLALQVSRGSCCFLQGVQKRLPVYVNIKYLYAV
jgi:hypothetical protein